MNELCGCCQPIAPLTPLAVQNLPGLSTIAYRIGTYASFRETMLEAIAHSPELAVLTTRQDDDYSITIIDLWAAVADVLTFYQERYANEVFLRTAQQPESIRCIARLLDYRPRPGVAALAQLAFTLDAGKILNLPAGLKVQSVADQDQQPQTFETLEPLAADARLNRLRAYPPPTVEPNPLAVSSTEAILDRNDGPAMAADLAVNDTVVLFNNAGTAPVEEKKIAAIRMEDDRVIITWSTPISATTWNAATRVWKFKRTFRLFGYNASPSYMQSETSASVPGGIKWTLKSLGAADYQYPRPGKPCDPSPETSRTLYLDATYNDLSPGLAVLAADTSGTVFTTVNAIDQAQDSLGNLSDTVTRLKDLKRPTDDTDVNVSFTDRRTVIIYELVGPELQFWPGRYATSVYGAALYLPGRCIADAQGPGVEVGRVIQQNAFLPGVVLHPSDIAPGRMLILTDATGSAVPATVHSALSIEPASASPDDFCHLVLNVDAEALQLQTASAALLGNVAIASHGETVSNEPLGSGDASKKFQSFQLQKAPLTYVPDTSPTGLSSSLQVSINQERWSEVPELYGQPGTARVYSASIIDEGKTAVQFGDGTMGALLPTGQANVLATYRVGAGLAGRVGANTLTTLLNRPTNLSAATNPLPAEGGADPESMATARENAPRTVRTFGRVVSLRDFEDLVTASGEVAKAQADWVWDGFAPAVHLTVAGQEGGTFSAAGLARLGAALNAARDANHRLLMDNFVRVPIRIQATVLPDPARSKDTVLAAALQALLQYLSFDQRKLGQSIHLSNIYAVLQGVTGVIAADVIVLGFKQPTGMTPAQFYAYLAARGVTFLPSGDPAPVQGHLRIFTARSDPAKPGSILPAELAWVATSAQDVIITAQGG
jgi:uncharacterized phage protein gp47/JayE